MSILMKYNILVSGCKIYIAFPIKFNIFEAHWFNFDMVAWILKDSVRMTSRIDQNDDPSSSKLYHTNILIGAIALQTPNQ